MTEERQKARRLESETHEMQTALDGKPLDWRRDDYKQAFGTKRRKGPLAAGAKKALDRLSEKEVKDFQKLQQTKGKASQ